MRSTLADYGLIQPKSLREALEALESHPPLRPIAGGTDLMVYLEAGSLPACTFLDLDAIPEIQSRLIWTDGLTLSALTTYADVRRAPEVARRYPLLTRAAREIGALAVQTRGTWAGNVANGSPAADGVPALMAYDGVVVLQSSRGVREVPLAGLYRGYKELDLRPDELITAIRLASPPPSRKEYYRKVGTRRFQAISKTLLSGWMTLAPDGTVSDIRMVFASVAPHTLRAVRTEALVRRRAITPDLIEEACTSVQDEIHPIDDIRSTATYRRAVTSNLVREFLRMDAGSTLVEPRS